ncbi:TonB-dependent receptor [Alteromonas pelagimontana]|uniref:TonB-dependent receptor n=1 Tax=Alteromonas pelagimontana TaxID=1858656 RepID=A0A6M4MAD7_9ALTE|nr:TonB-dependent receptor plug domain-containing protein [Alteromonas pelagimontana]QJR79939.1 TonB-dependent receptor [Alteromonas pelagimontana]
MNKNVISLSLFCLSFSAVAQEADLERITVTGDFRQATLDQLSTSASVVGEARLASRQADHIDSMLNIAPNVNFSTGASRGRFIQIRGIGERSQFAEPINPSVSFLVDEFDFSGLAAAGVLFDTQQVEVYRGPQATLFGTGALAGAVKVVSRQPAADPSGYALFRLGNKDTYRIEAAHGDSITENVNYRAAVMQNKSDGFVNNTYLNREDTDNIDESAARLAVNWDVSADSSLAINYRWYDIDNGYDVFSLENNRNTRSDAPGYDTQRTNAVSLKSQTQTYAGDLAVILTHASHDIAYGYDEDWTYPEFHPETYVSVDSYFRDVATSTAEIRFTSSPQAALFSGRTQWLVGAFYKESEEDLLRQYTYLESPFNSTYQPTTKAVYFDTQTQLSEGLSLLAGVRIENYAFDYVDSDGIENAYDSDMTGGKLALNYVQGRHFWYGSISRGYKGAGINPDSRLPTGQRFYDAEFNWNYEVGYKGHVFTPDLTLRAAVFHMDREDTQISDYQIVKREDGSEGFIDIIGNAQIGTNRGIELELGWQATQVWQLQGSLGYLDATFESYTNAKGEQVDKREQAQAPSYTANIFSELWVAPDWVWRVDVDYKDSFRFSDGNALASPSTTLVNSEISWLLDAWTATLWVNNAFDRTYYTRGFSFENDPRQWDGIAESYYQLGDGRQYGITVKYQF